MPRTWNTEIVTIQPCYSSTGWFPFSASHTAGTSLVRTWRQQFSVLCCSLIAQSALLLALVVLLLSRTQHVNVDTAQRPHCSLPNCCLSQMVGQLVSCKRSHRPPRTMLYTCIAPGKSGGLIHLHKSCCCLLLLLLPRASTCSTLQQDPAAAHCGTLPQ
jgi:hypothetical protein